MIINSLSRSERTERLHPLFKKLFDYIRTHDLSQQPPGRIVLQGDDLFINLDQPQLRSRETQKLEVHRRYVDVHFPLSGAEEVGWRSLDTLPCESEAPFDEKNDFDFSNQLKIHMLYFAFSVFGQLKYSKLSWINKYKVIKKIISSKKLKNALYDLDVSSLHISRNFKISIRFAKLNLAVPLTLIF